MKKNVKKTAKKELTDVYVISYVDISDYTESVNVGTMMEAHSTFRKSYNYLMRSIEGFAMEVISVAKPIVMNEYGTTDPKEVAKKMIVKNNIKPGYGEVVVKLSHYMGSTHHYAIDRIALKYVK